MLRNVQEIGRKKEEMLKNVGEIGKKGGYAERCVKRKYGKTELFWAVFTEEGSAQATINILRSCSPFSCFCALFSFIIGVCSLHLYPLAIMIMSIMLALCFCVFQLYTFCLQPISNVVIYV